MSFEDAGLFYLKALIQDSLGKWLDVTEKEFAHSKAGHRISKNADLNAAADNLLKSERITSVIGEGWQCVRAIAFNKSPQSNWSLGWHQDRTIAVQNKADVSGFGPWSIKDGIVHVEPPFELLERMMTLRLHFDDTPADNGALLVAPTSHRRGMIPVTQVDAILEACGITQCEAKAGDVWLYSTPILHASARASVASSRRVLHLDFSKDQLPPPLKWYGID